MLGDSSIIAVTPRQPGLGPFRVFRSNDTPRRRLAYISRAETCDDLQIRDEGASPDISQRRPYYLK